MPLAGDSLLVCVCPCGGPSQVAEWRQLALVASLVRFAEDPQWLTVEWADGTPASTYVTPARCLPLPGLEPELGRSAT